MAISDETSVYNLALSAIGARSNISSPSESSREAEVCRLWYEAVRDQVFSAAHWPEATRFNYLSVINEQNDDTWAAGEAMPGYRYSYAAPIDMIRPQYLSDYSPFKITSAEDTSTAVNTNAYKALLVYTFRNKLVSRWSAGLQMAVVYGLAAHICLPLSGKTQRASQMLSKANDFILRARETSANWDNQPLEVIPDWIQARGFANPAPSRFIYPLGDLLSVAS